jgi:EAL and modified HD-GYP domain-containing signal transduction protein
VNNVFVGRQPIFDNKLNVYGYELLYRATDQANNSGGMVNASQATTTTIINTFVEIGLERLVRNKLAAINLTEDFLLEDGKLPFAPSQVILEILEDVLVTAKLIEAVQRLVDAGYLIALDDYLYNPEHAPLLQLAKIVKIDLMALDKTELERHVQQLKKYDLRLLAEKVETADEFIHCRDLGFDYFQGYFLSKPQIIKGQSLPSNRLTILNLLAVLHNPDSHPEDLAEAINTDVTTSYKLLKLINSAAFNLQREITSIEQGVMLLGRQKLCSWASMLALSTLNDRPSEILRTAMTRAKMCELLAEKSGECSSDSYFTVGMFSALDLLLQRSLEQLLAPLPLSDEITNALLHHQGRLGEVLTCVMAYEVSDWEHARLSQVSDHDVLVSNIEAVTWANVLMDTL